MSRFLLPSLQVDNILGQTNPRQVREALRTLPSALVDHLDLTMERIKSQDSQGQPRTDLAMDVLMWLSHVKRPLTVNEMQHAIATISGMDRLVELTDPSFFTECCFGLVTIDTATSTIRLVHLSINEYLQERAKILFPSAHGELAITCLTYLSLNNFYNVKLSTQDDCKELSSKFHILDYAVSYWGVHAAICFNAEVERTTYEFLNNRPPFELWNQLYEAKEDVESDISKYVIQEVSALHVSAIFGIEKLALNALTPGNSDPNPRDSVNRTPLMLAAAYGQKGLLKLLLSRDGIRINLTDLKGKTALGFAVDRAQFDIVQLLLSCSGVDINTDNPFVAACEKASKLSDDTQLCSRIVKLFLSRPDLDVNTPRLSTDRWPRLCPAWEWIGRTFDWELLRMLLSRKDFDPSAYLCEQVEVATFDLRSYMLNSDHFVEGTTLSMVPMIHALDADHRFHLPEFAFLELSWSFLYFAFTDDVQGDGPPGDYWYNLGPTEIRENASGTLRAKLRNSLEELGFSFDTRDSHGRTYLHFVAQSGPLKYDGLHFLLQRGADVSVTDRDGCTPLHYAVKEGQVANISILLDAGADLHARDKSGATVLHVAARSENSEPMITLLLDRGAESSINTIDKPYNNTPLHEAAWSKCVETCRLLLQRGANPNLCSIVGTPLHAGAHVMDEKVLLAILSGGGNPNLLDCYGRSTFDWIASYKPLAKEIAPIMLKCKPTPQHVTSRHLLQSMQKRIDLMLSVENKTRDELRYRLGHQLLYLGDEESARTIFETLITTKIKSSVIESEEYCSQCFTNTRHLFFCKRCPLVVLCSKCLKDRKDDKVPWCQGHDFLKVPGDGWKDLPIGVVNKRGQSFEEWLKDLQTKYCGELTTNGVHQGGH